MIILSLGKCSAISRLCGVSPSKEVDREIDDHNDLDYADHELWDDIIWPALYHRVPAFGEVKVMSSWAGLYECELNDLFANCWDGLLVL